MMNRKILIVAVVVVLICLIAGCFLLWKQVPTQSPSPPTPPAKPKKELKLSDFPEVFKEKTVIVLGDNASEIERQAAEEIKNFLLEQGSSDIKITDLQKIENFKGYNLVIIGTPKTNPFLEEMYALTNATRVTEEFPGEGKGVLEILRNPWDESKVMLLVEGSDGWGVKASIMELEQSHDINKTSITVEWEAIIEDDTLKKFSPDLQMKIIAYASNKTVVGENETLLVIAYFDDELSQTQIDDLEKEYNLEFRRFSDGNLIRIMDRAFSINIPIAELERFASRSDVKYVQIGEEEYGRIQ